LITWVASHNAYSIGTSSSRKIGINTPSSIPLKLSDSNGNDDWSVRLRSPCKLNLFLRILGRRPSGFHDLASLFQVISLSDYLYMSKLPVGSTKDEMTCSDTTLTVTDDNLVIKGLDLMRKKTNIDQYFKVHLEKTVPIQAGLGGGSGNAATAMHGFNVLTDYPVQQVEQLAEWSGDIGSDISFFFSSGTAYCTGRGEIVESLPALPFANEVIVDVFKPIAGLSTPSVFKALDLNACSKEAAESILASFTAVGAVKAALEGKMINDLEAPAFSCLPDLLALKQEIEACTRSVGIAGVMMSGSGTSVYSLRTPSEVQYPTATIISKFPLMKHFPCEFLNRKNDVYSWYE
jgi:4-diphosphocytidyl-2-C-methyl-D-erythritol kinase